MNQEQIYPAITTDETLIDETLIDKICSIIGIKQFVVG